MDNSIVDNLGEDLVLLSITDKGNIATSQRIDYGLMGSELVRLAASGRIDIEAGHVVVRDAAPVGDAELNAALDSLVQAKKPPRPRNWVAWRRPGLRSAYLNRLVSSRALSTESRRILGTRYLIADPARRADARARLDAIALTTGQVDVAQAALGGLAYAIGIDHLLYPRQVCKRLRQIAGGQWTVEAVTGAAPDAAASDAIAAATQVSFRAVVQAATTAAIEAANAAAPQ